MELDVSMYTRQFRRTLAMVFLVVLPLVALFFARGYIARLVSPSGENAPSAAQVEAVVRDFLDGRLASDDSRITERMAADVERLANLPHGEFIAFEEDLHVIALSPKDAPTWARMVGSARYRAPAGDVFLGEITVEALKEGDAWKVDRILVRPLVSEEQ